MKKNNYYDFNNWWEKNGIFVIIFGSVFLILLFILIRKCFKHKFKNNKFLGNIFGTNIYKSNSKHIEDNTNKEKGKESKGETECKIVAEEIFKKPFIKIRPDFLYNNITKQNLELDLYNEELNLAFEYNGKQHYEYVPYFHKSKDSFYNQQYRDQIKKNLCEKNKIILIEVPYTVKIENIKSYIIEKLKTYNQFKTFL